MIILSRVKKTYGKRTALATTDLTVERERCLALVGPSGSGKSTLLRMVLGLVVPDEGRVEVGGKVVDQRSAPALRLGMGYVIQDGGLFPHLSAEDNVGLVATQQGWTAERKGQRVRELSELVHLPRELLLRYPVELSGGERQRVGIMRALMLDPPLLLLDEPLGSLDPVIRAHLQEDLQRIFRELHKTVLIVTHDLAEAAFLGDEIALLNDGALVQKGAWGDFLRDPKDAFVTEFFRAQRVVGGGPAAIDVEGRGR